MPVAHPPYARAAAVVTACLAAAGCDSTSFDESSFRTARQQRSAVALAQYIADDLRDDYKDEARALLDAQFEHALAHLGERRNAELARALLERLRAAGDPRIVVRIRAPRLSGKLGLSATEYFEGRSSWDYSFAEGASRASAALFPHEVLMFATPSSYDFDASQAGVEVDVEWSVHATGALFDGPASIASIGRETPPVQGIGVEATLRFTLRGTDAEPIEVTASGDPGGEVSYTSMVGFATEDDVYAGMVKGSFERAVTAVFEPLDRPAP